MSDSAQDLVLNTDQEVTKVDVVPLTEDVAPIPMEVRKEEKVVGKEIDEKATEVMNGPAVQVAANAKRIIHKVVTPSDDSDDDCHSSAAKRRKVVAPLPHEAPTLPNDHDDLASMVSADTEPSVPESLPTEKVSVDAGQCSEDYLYDPDDVVFIDHERPAPPFSSDDHPEDV